MQKFKGIIHTRTKVVNRILRVYEQRSEVDIFDWYQDANEHAQYISLVTGVSLIQACGVLAALSPLKSWDINKRIALEFIQGKKPEHTRTMVGKARDILKTHDVNEICDILNGQKITSFFLNIYNPTDSTVLTIDRHAISICLGRSLRTDENYGMTVKQYTFFQECFRLAGIKAGIEPIKIQAITWETWRRLKRPQTQQINEIEVPF